MKEDNKICGIYKITNPVGYCYIGQSTDILKRFQTHKTRSTNFLLTESFLKYGVENHTFEILEECNNNLLLEREKHYIFLYYKKTIIFNDVVFNKTPIKPTNELNNTLENLIIDSGLSEYAFAKRVGVSAQALGKQKKSKKTFNLSVKYANILGIKRIYGIEEGMDIDLELK